MSHGVWDHGLMFVNAQETTQAIGSDSWSRFLFPNTLDSSLTPDCLRHAKTSQDPFTLMMRSQEEGRLSSASSVEPPDEPLWVTLLGSFAGVLAFLVTWIYLA